MFVAAKHCLPELRLALVRKYPTILSLLWLALLFWESAQTGDPLGVMPFPQFDKLVHLIIYAVLGLLLAWSLVRDWNFKSIFWIFLLAL
jgi:hypothetical protein